MDKQEYSVKEKRHISLMMQILHSLKGTPLILKGGTALMLYYGLDRFSVDLDFDSTKKINIASKVSDLTKNEFKISDLNIKKDTATTQRIIINYDGLDGARERLKVEVSFRLKDGDYNPDIVNGVKVAPIAEIFNQKLRAAHDGDDVRDAVRDLYDLVFIASFYGAKLNDSDKERFWAFSRSEADLLDRYMPDYLLDDLVRTRINLDDLCIKASAAGAMLHSPKDSSRLTCNP